MAEHDSLVTKLDVYFVTESSGHTAAHEDTLSRAEQRDIVRGAVESVRPVEPVPSDRRRERSVPVPFHSSDRQLVSDAKSALQNALPLADAFAEHGLPANVLADLP